MRDIKSLKCAHDGATVEFMVEFEGEGYTISKSGIVSDLCSCYESKSKQESKEILEKMRDNFDDVDVIGGQCMECEDECSFVTEFKDGTKFNRKQQQEAFEYFLKD